MCDECCPSGACPSCCRGGYCGGGCIHPPSSLCRPCSPACPGWRLSYPSRCCRDPPCCRKHMGCTKTYCGPHYFSPRYCVPSCYSGLTCKLPPSNPAMKFTICFEKKKKC